MAIKYQRLWDPVNQFQLKNGAINVAGRIFVRLEATDDLAPLFDENGTQMQQPIILDNNGRSHGVFVDSSKTYWIDVQDRDGMSLFTIRKMTACGGGGGSTLSGQYDIISSDGFLHVEKFVDAGITTFDLTHLADGSDILEWIRCDGGAKVDATDSYRPNYTDGTMEVGTNGVILQADQYYHVTAHVRATKTAVQPFYDKVDVLFKLDDGSEVVNNVRQSVVVDYSMGISQDFEVSTDVKTTNACELVIDILSQDVQGGAFELLNLEIHRVYSGAPSIPSGVLSRVQAAELYQPILTPGRNIDITENVISYAPSRAWRSMHGSTWCDCGDCFGFLVDDNHYDPDNLITVVKGTNEDSEHNVTHWGEIHIAAGHSAIVVTSLTLLRIPGEVQPTLNSIALWYGGNPASIYGARHEFLYDNSQSNEVVPQIVGYFPATENGATITLGCSAGTTWYYYKPTELWVAVLD